MLLWFHFQILLYYCTASISKFHDNKSFLQNIHNKALNTLNFYNNNLLLLFNHHHLHFHYHFLYFNFIFFSFPVADVFYVFIYSCFNFSLSILFYSSIFFFHLSLIVILHDWRIQQISWVFDFTWYIFKITQCIETLILRIK